MDFDDTILVAMSLVCIMSQLALQRCPGDTHYLCLCLHSDLSGKSRR